MRILITGANGLLGQKLTEKLWSDDDIYVISTARSESIVPIAKGEFVQLDVTHGQQVHDVIAKTKPDLVIHTAAMTNVDQCHKDRKGCWTTNVTAVENIIAACEKHNVHLIHLSTDFVFDGSHGPLDEQESTGPVNFYGESKAAAESLVINSQLSWCIIRTVLVYGITKGPARSNIVLWVRDNLSQGKSINVVNDQWRTPTLAEDLAVGCHLAAKKKAQGIFHISGKDLLSPFEIAVKTADFFGLDKGLIKPVDSATLNQEAKRPARTGFIIEKARRELGYQPHSFTEGIEIMVKQLPQR